MVRQWLPPLSAAVYWCAVALRARHFKRAKGLSANLKPRTGREKALWAGWALVVAGWAAAPALSVRTSFEGPLSTFCGTACVLAGLAGTVWAHRSIGDAWRVGVREDEKTPLVTAGVYRWVRHPIYAFQCLILAGVLLLAPSPAMLAVLFAHRFLVSLKIRDEEAHLERLHGPLYKEYASKTGSLWPKLKSA